MRARDGLRALLLLVAGSGACASRLFDAPGDGGAADDAALPVDGGGSDDLAASGACGLHQLVAVPLTGLRTVDDVWRFGAAIRVEVELPLDACDAAGEVDVTVQPGNATDGVTLVAYVWRHDPSTPGCGTATSVRRVLVLSDTGELSSPNLFVRDGAPGGTLTLKGTVEPPAGQTCQAAPVGMPCSNDCQCQATDPAARCIPIQRGIDVAGFCAVSCSDDGDCAGEAERPSCGTPSAVRATCGGGGTCQSDGDCPTGWRCAQTPTGGACRPTLPSTDEAPCNCDGDCSAGEICNPEARCARPCAAVGDCAPSPDGSFVPICALSFCGRSI